MELHIPTISQPEHVIQHSTKDSGSDSEQENWSFDRAINEVFRLLPPELCPRPTEVHILVKPLSGIQHLMECDSIICIATVKVSRKHFQISSK